MTSLLEQQLVIDIQFVRILHLQEILSLRNQRNFTRQLHYHLKKY